jgi:hypothetical protein
MCGFSAMVLYPKENTSIQLSKYFTHKELIESFQEQFSVVGRILYVASRVVLVTGRVIRVVGRTVPIASELPLKQEKLSTTIAGGVIFSIIQLLLSPAESFL